MLIRKIFSVWLSQDSYTIRVTFSSGGDLHLFLNCQGRILAYKEDELAGVNVTEAWDVRAVCHQNPNSSINFLHQLTFLVNQSTFFINLPSLSIYFLHQSIFFNREFSLSSSFFINWLQYLPYCYLTFEIFIPKLILTIWNITVLELLRSVQQYGWIKSGKNPSSLMVTHHMENGLWSPQTPIVWCLWQNIFRTRDTPSWRTVSTSQNVTTTTDLNLPDDDGEYSRVMKERRSEWYVVFSIT